MYAYSQCSWTDHSSKLAPLKEDKTYQLKIFSTRTLKEMLFALMMEGCLKCPCGNYDHKFLYIYSCQLLSLKILRCHITNKVRAAVFDATTPESGVWFKQMCMTVKTPLPHVTNFVFKVIIFLSALSLKPSNSHRTALPQRRGCLKPTTISL